MSKGKIFNAQEVQALIAGNKTMFREITPFQPTNELAVDSLLRLYKPYQVGQMIFVKESFNIFAGQVAYKQNLASAEKYFWKPAQQMKQEQSRLTLLIKEIRVERLADISEEDAIAEGIPLSVEFKDRYYTSDGNYATPKIAFMRWWNSTHKKPEEKFEANPWVWSIQFEVVK
jgi:hypothetical protein